MDKLDKIETIKSSRKFRKELFIPVRNVHYQIILQLIADFFAFTISFIIQYSIRFKFGLFDNHFVPDVLDFVITGAVVVLYWYLVFFIGGMYKNWYERSPFDEIFSVLKVVFVGCFIMVFFIFMESSQSPRLLFIIYYLILSFSVIFFRTLSRRIQRQLRIKGIISIPVVILGSPKKAFEFYHKLNNAKAWGYKCLGIILLESENFEEELAAIDEKELRLIIGNVSELENILREYSPMELIVTANEPHGKILLRIAEICGEQNVRFMIEPDLYEIFTGQTRTQNLYGIPLIEISTQLLKPWQEIVKRTLDIVLSFLILTIGLPIWILIAVLIKITSKGPILYTQYRVGKNGKEFKMYKFRSMYQNSDKMESWTKVNDPRVTPFGRFLRKTHLDEIPQFINVLKGDMSIVGPRPEQKAIVEKYSKTIPFYKRRLIVRPGITGWWQVKYKPFELNEEEIMNRIKDDFYYIENMSIKLDTEIIIRTIWCVISGHGQT